jgi:hypothetical protein
MPKLNKNKTQTAPLAKSKLQVTKSAKVIPSGTGVRIRHEEFFAVMTAPDALSTVWGYTIQPGFAELFPWLSGIATRYERYTIHSLSLKYVARCPATTTGIMVMCADQDANDAMPSEDEAGRAAMMAHTGAVSGSVWADLTMKLPPGWERSKDLFVRASGEASTVEPRTADAGMIFLGIFGKTDGTIGAFGDLMVCYDIEFHLPQLLNLPKLSLTGFVQPRESYSTTFSKHYPWAQYYNNDLSVYSVLADGNLPLVVKSLLKATGWYPSATHIPAFSLERYTGFKGDLSWSQKAKLTSTGDLMDQEALCDDLKPRLEVYDMMGNLIQYIYGTASFLKHTASNWGIPALAGIATFTFANLTLGPGEVFVPNLITTDVLWEDFTSGPTFEFNNWTPYHGMATGLRLQSSGGLSTRKDPPNLFSKKAESGQSLRLLEGTLHDANSACASSTSAEGDGMRTRAPVRR